MPDQRLDKYYGKYRAGRSPARLSPHNEATWKRLTKLLQEQGGTADFDSLSTAAKGHDHGTEGKRYGYQFIIYCIKNGWLEKID